MEKSVFALAVDEIQASLRPALKAAGFKMKGRTFNRRMEDGLVHVIGIQMGASDPPGTTYIPGLRENLHGMFAVNLGVYVPEVSAVTNGTEKDWVPEYYCCIRSRLGALIGNGKEYWWHARATDEVKADVLAALKGTAMDFFAQFPERQTIVDLALGDRHQPWFGTPLRISAAVILVKRGDLAGARTLLQRQVLETNNPGHPAYVRKLAINLGIGEL